MNKRIIFGDAGYFYIPDAGVRVPLYAKGSRKIAQDTVDAEDSALLASGINGGHCAYIADHAAQGFDAIKRCTLGTLAYIVTPNSTRFYICNAVTEGTNLKTDLVTLGNERLSRIQWADLCAYCCNDDKGRSISMVFFRAGTRLPYNLFPAI